MAKLKEEARQILASGKPAEQQMTALVACIDALPDEPVINAESLAPIKAAAAKLAEHGTEIVAACDKADVAAIANAIETLGGRIRLMAKDGEQIQALTEQVNSLKAGQAESDWKEFYQQNKAKITPAESEDLHQMFLKDRDWTVKHVANKAVLVNQPAAAQAAGSASDPEAEWKANSALRDEFGDDKNAYLAFCKAEADGLVHIKTGK